MSSWRHKLRRARPYSAPGAPAARPARVQQLAYCWRAVKRTTRASLVYFIYIYIVTRAYVYATRVQLQRWSAFVEHGQLFFISRNSRNIYTYAIARIRTRSALANRPPRAHEVNSSLVNFDPRLFRVSLLSSCCCY
ncbi:unnamed protein product [Trichogramma brassicae]|uniref:Uncharacterized protein n=1 Tax=Trichogramma brassicae TaxID=86971 RepID=A0A6H5J2D0_9HYME|nr:unnamed protein product [Trichogramma brassicae]